jgi:hypothetical protein
MSAEQKLTESPLSVVHEVLRDWLEENEPTDFDENDVAHFFGMLGTAGYSIVPNIDEAKLAKLNEDVIHNLANGPLFIEAGVRWVQRSRVLSVLEQLTQAGSEVLARLRAAEAQVVKVYELLDKEFDQHHSDSKSKCTPQQAQFYKHCEGAIAMFRMHLEKEVPEPKPAPTAKPKPVSVPTKEVLAALFWEKYRGQLTRRDEPLEADDIRDIMPFREDGSLHVQVHIRGYTDWYSVRFEPLTIEKLPF